jgi:hypothetical protein
VVEGESPVVNTNYFKLTHSGDESILTQNILLQLKNSDNDTVTYDHLFIAIN